MRKASITWRRIGAFSILGAGFAMGSVSAQEDPYELARFPEWFPGEYNNYEQVWQEAIDSAADPHDRIHHIFAPVDYPALGDHIFYTNRKLRYRER